MYIYMCALLLLTKKKKENTSVIHFLSKAEKAPEKGKQK